MLRTTTRISHSKSIVTLDERVSGLAEPKLVRNAAKLVMLPGNARVRHPLVEERIKKLSEAGTTMAINRLELRDSSIGIITSGVCYQYVREAMPGASTLKLGMVHPLPKALIREFAAQMDKLYVVEELDPFIEEQVRAMGIAVTGKELIPLCGELTPGRIRTAFGLRPPPAALGGKTPRPSSKHVPRLPSPRSFLCPQSTQGLCHRRYRLLHPWVHAAALGHGYLHLHGSLHRHGHRR